MSVLRHFRKCWPSAPGPEDEKDREIKQSRHDSRIPSGKAYSALSSAATLNQSPLTDNSFLSVDVKVKELPASQTQLCLHAIGEEFSLVQDVALPSIQQDDELLVQVSTVGLNPIDWKAPAFGWGLPSLPCVLGRDFVGTIVQTSKADDRKLALGMIVGCISTDYRDYRKAAFQGYVVALSYNVFRVPSRYLASQREIAALGVAFVTAALAFGVCLGGRVRNSAGQSVDLLDMARRVPSGDLPEDIRRECANAVIDDSDRITSGDWILIWGAGSTVGFMLVQLAKLAGLKVICVADTIRSGSVLVDVGADAIVHRRDAQEAAEIIAGLSKGKELRFGIDTVGKDTSSIVQSALHGIQTRSKHIVGLVGLPEADEGVYQHKAPIKLFHEVPAIGKALMNLLEDLLQEGRLALPKVHIHEHHGLDGVNTGLRLLRSGGFGAQRIVVPIR